MHTLSHTHTHYQANTHTHCFWTISSGYCTKTAGKKRRKELKNRYLFTVTMKEPLPRGRGTRRARTVT